MLNDSDDLVAEITEFLEKPQIWAQNFAEAFDALAKAAEELNRERDA